MNLEIWGNCREAKRERQKAKRKTAARGELRLKNRKTGEEGFGEQKRLKNRERGLGMAGYGKKRNQKKKTEQQGKASRGEDRKSKEKEKSGGGYSWI